MNYSNDSICSRCKSCSDPSYAASLCGWSYEFLPPDQHRFTTIPGLKLKPFSFTVNGEDLPALVAQYAEDFTGDNALDEAILSLSEAVSSHCSVSMTPRPCAGADSFSMSPVSFKVQPLFLVSVTPSDLEAILCLALFNSADCFWAEIDTSDFNAQSPFCTQIVQRLLDGHSVTLSSITEDAPGETWQLELKGLLDGVRQFLESQHLAELNIDAIDDWDADMILQFALFHNMRFQ